MFMTSEALYIVVFDLSRPLNTRATVIDSTSKTRTHHWTNLQFILSYIQTVYSHSRIVEDDKPTILIVGTHKGELGDDEVNKLFDEIYKALKDKPYEEHVHRPYFAIENSNAADKSFIQLKQEIEKLMTKLKKHVPLKWMRFRCNLHDLRKPFPLYPLKEIKILASKNGIVSEREQSVVLDFLYDIGEIIYMPDRTLLRGQVVVNPNSLVNIVTQFVTVVPPKPTEFIKAYRKLGKGILEEVLLQKCCKECKVDVCNVENFEFLVELMIQLGFLCERKTTSSQDVASTSTESDVKRSFFVPLRFAFKTSRKVKPKPDDSQSISIYYDFEGYLPDVLFPYVVNEFLSKFQSDGFKTELSCNYAELYLNEIHHVTLSLVNFETKKNDSSFEQKFLLKMTIKQNKKCDLYPQACQKALSTVEKTFEQSKDGGRRGIPFKRCILCSCSDKKKKHIRKLDTSKDELHCNITGKDFWTDVTCYKRLFGEISPVTDAVPDCIQDVPSNSPAAPLLPSANQPGQLNNPILNQMRSFWKFLKEHWCIVTVFLFCLLAIAVILMICFPEAQERIGLGASLMFTCGVPLIWYVHKKITRAQQSENTTAGRQTTTV